MKKLLTFSLLALACVAGFAQSVTLTFTGRDANNRRVQLDRVVITNLTCSWQETIMWPDTTLTMQNGVGIVENGTNGGFSLSQNNPNPFDGTTSTALTTAEAGAVALEITDVNGRLVSAQNFASLQPGTHQFRISVANAGTYVLTARQNGKVTSVKMVNNGNGAADAIEYQGMANESFQLKNGAKGNTNNPFTFGDQMEYVGYATINGNEEESARIMQQQGASQTFALQFSASMDGYPCPGMPTITDRDNNTYNTVLIGTQCWMKENLKTTKYADGTAIANGTTTSTTTAYWYYPNNSSSNQSTYGLLYNWKAVMRNSSSSASNPSGVQGICPTGWHVPSDNEWKQMEMAVGMSQSDADNAGYRGNIAAKLSGNTGWNSSGNANAAGNLNAPDRNSSGFSALPAGYYSSSYNLFGNGADFWSATEYSSDNAYSRTLYYSNAYVLRNNFNKSYGFSVRCLRN